MCVLQGKMDQEKEGKGTDGEGSTSGAGPGQGTNVEVGVCANPQRIAVKWKECQQPRRRDEGDVGSLKRGKLYSSCPGG